MKTIKIIELNVDGEEYPGVFPVNHSSLNFYLRLILSDIISAKKNTSKNDAPHDLIIEDVDTNKVIFDSKEELINDENLSIDFWYDFIIGKIDAVVPNKLIWDEFVAVYTPEDELLISTNSEIMFNDILLQIKHKHLDGYYIMFNDTKYNISKYGNLESEWPKGLFDCAKKQLHQLLEIKLKNE